MECTPLRISSCEWFAHQDWVEGYLVQLHQLELDSLDNHLLENDLKKEMTGTIKSLIIGIQFCQSLKAIPLNILPLPIYWWGVFCLTHSKSLKFLELPVPFSHLQKFSILRYPHQTKNIPTLLMMKLSPLSLRKSCLWGTPLENFIYRGVGCGYKM